MPSAEFRVDAASVLLQCEIDLQRDENAIGLRFGLRELRRHLAAIGQRAIELNDPELTRILVAMCVLRSSDEGQRDCAI